MADSTEAVHVIAAGAPAPENSSLAVEGPVSAGGGVELRSLREVARSLPPHAVRDLLCNEVCPRCIFRLFGVQDHIYSCSSTSQLVLSSILDELADPQRSMVDNDFSEKKESSRPLKESEVELGLCRICLGIVQCVYRDDKDTLVKKDAAKDFASSIAELVKKEGYQIDNFSLEVSVPPIISENENAVWLYMKKKYGSELWFQERSRSVLISAKDVLKFSIADSLETLLDVKSGPGSFRIRLTYTHPKASDMISCSSKSNAGGKRQKTGAENSFETVDESMAARIQHSEFSTSKTNAVTETSLNGSQNHESSECFKFPKDKVNEPCRLAFLCYRTSIYFGGRYLKFSRNVSQSRWIIDDERMGEASVEEILGSNILPMCRGDSYKFHAAGREDIDVRMLGSGRPFLVEILNARLVPSQVLAKQIEEKINNVENKLVQVKNLKVVGSEGWALMREGESDKQKQYAALLWISRPLEDKDLESLSSFNDLKILQRTPVRVLHRRSPLDREKIIHWMKIEKIAESSQYFILHLSTQAGTYIKEFVHGDLGRTHPNIGSILGCRAEILQLDVTDVKMDCFMTES